MEVVGFVVWTVGGTEPWTELMLGIWVRLATQTGSGAALVALVVLEIQVCLGPELVVVGLVVVGLLGSWVQVVTVLVVVELLGSWVMVVAGLVVWALLGIQLWVSWVKELQAVAVPGAQVRAEPWVGLVTAASVDFVV